MARPGDAHAKIALLAAAEAEFVAHGLERARVEDITARAGRSKGSFYLHFPSKEAAFGQLVESLLARLQSTLDECARELASLDRPEIDLPTIKAAALEQDIRLFELLWQDRALVRLVLEGGHSSSWSFLIDELSERARAASHAFLSLGIRRGWFRPELDLDVVSVAISGAYDRLARSLMTSHKKPDFPRQLREMQRFIYGGISGAEHSDRSVNHRPPRAAGGEGPASSRRARRSPRP
jgi:AcrR family transcriptional regulator